MTEKHILFVCEHGAAKSILAAAYFNKLATETNSNLRAIARGTHPDKELSPKTITGLRADGLTPTETTPQKLTLSDLQNAERIISFCELPQEFQNQVPTEQWDNIPPVSENYASARDAILEALHRLPQFSNLYSSTPPLNASLDPTIPHQTYTSLFLRFLKFGVLAWGGPVAQIAMIRQELVEEEKWITPTRFNRVLAVYQALPGPEAHELCVYFGMVARGRVGALLAGLGFMLPGFVLMLALSWFYVTYGINSPLFQAVFIGMQPAVAALIVRAVHRIGSHALNHNWLWIIAFLAACAHLLNINFLITLLISGLIYTLAQRNQKILTWILVIGFVTFLFLIGLSTPQPTLTQPTLTSTLTKPASLLTLAWSGLKSGLLTFGGAYTVIPFLRHDAVQVGAWMTDAQFLDGLALSSLLPAPLIIFSTFVGYIGGGLWGAIIVTVAIFSPAFAFTMLGHEYLEKLVENKSAHAFLDGITAGVVGLISTTALGILSQTIVGLHAWIIFSLALLTLFQSKAKWTVAAVVIAAGLYGFLLM